MDKPEPDLQDLIEEMYSANQSELPEVDKAAPLGEPYCSARHDLYVCTKTIGHEGDHVAHSSLGHAVARWA